MRNLNYFSVRLSRLDLIAAIVILLISGRTLVMAQRDAEQSGSSDKELSQSTDNGPTKPASDGQSQSAGNEQTQSARAKGTFSHPHCGLYCLYAAARLTGQEIDFEELIRPEYLGSRKGSSLAELKKAAEDNGLYAAYVGNMTTRILRRCPYLVVLHVKPDLTYRQYTHYELFLGTDNDKARILDPPLPVSLVSFRDLATLWDGNGLIISRRPVDLMAVIGPMREQLMTYVAIGAAIVAAVYFARRRWLQTVNVSRRQRLIWSAAQGAGFALAALVCGMLYHFANDAGFLAHPSAPASVRQAHLANFVPKIGERKVRKLIGTNTVFIDARRINDFKAGHLKDAVNIPVDANDRQFQETAAGLVKEAPIVVYCQSAACKFAERVTIRLLGEGFSNISIFKGGWREWVARNSTLYTVPRQDEATKDRI